MQPPSNSCKKFRRPKNSFSIEPSQVNAGNADVPVRTACVSTLRVFKGNQSATEFALPRSMRTRTSALPAAGGSFRADDFLGKVGATPSDGTYRKPQSVFPSKRAYRFVSLRGVRVRAVPGYRASLPHCPVSGWRKNGGAHAG